jgi:hypothetical protein
LVSEYLGHGCHGNAYGTSGASALIFTHKSSHPRTSFIHVWLVLLGAFFSWLTSSKVVAGTLLGTQGHIFRFWGWRKTSSSWLENAS